MALIWMRHKDHGIIDVYDNASVESNQKNGWEVFDRDAETTPKKVEPAPAAPVAEEPATVPDWMSGASAGKPVHPRKGK